MKNLIKNKIKFLFSCIIFFILLFRNIKILKFEFYFSKNLKVILIIIVWLILIFFELSMDISKTKDLEKI